MIASSNILLTLNDALTHSAVFVQGHGSGGEGLAVHVPFPFNSAPGEISFSFFTSYLYKIKPSQAEA